MDNINLDQMLAEAAGDETPEVETPETEVQPEVETPEVEAPEVVKTSEKQPEQKKPNPIKEVRDRLNVEQKAKEKIEKTVQRFTDGDYKFKIRDFRTEDGKVDYDALSAAMDDADLKAKAETRGISPEVQAEIDRIEKEKIELQRERLRVSMDRAIATMQTDMNLKNDDINNFFKDSMALKKNPYQWLAQGGTLNDLYYLVYRERLIKDEVNKAVEEAKAKWEEAKTKKAPTSNPAASTTHTSSTTISLDSLLQDAVK
jgi:hypothetical protein